MKKTFIAFALILALASFFAITTTAADSSTAGQAPEWFFCTYARFSAAIEDDSTSPGFADGRFIIPVFTEGASYNSRKGYHCGDQLAAVTPPFHSLDVVGIKTREVKCRIRLYATDLDQLAMFTRVVQVGVEFTSQGRLWDATCAQSAVDQRIYRDRYGPFTKSNWLSIGLLHPGEKLEVHPYIWAVAPVEGEFFVIIDVGYFVLHIKPSDQPPAGLDFA